MPLRIAYARREAVPSISETTIVADKSQGPGPTHFPLEDRAPNKAEIGDLPGPPEMFGNTLSALHAADRDE